MFIQAITRGTAVFVSAKKGSNFDELLRQADDEVKAYHAQKRKVYKQRSAGK